jgi:Flp pilus assembly protein TadD
LALSPTNPQVLNNLANVLMRLKDPGAVAIAEKATLQNPIDANLADTLGWALFQNSQIDRALQVLQAARSLDAKNSDVRYHLAVVLVQKGNKTEARAELEAALKNERPFESKTEAVALLKTLS